MERLYWCSESGEIWRPNEFCLSHCFPKLLNIKDENWFWVVWHQIIFQLSLGFWAYINFWLRYSEFRLIFRPIFILHFCTIHHHFKTMGEKEKKKEKNINECGTFSKVFHFFSFTFFSWSGLSIINSQIKQCLWCSGVGRPTGSVIKFTNCLGELVLNYIVILGESRVFTR